jgi:hypothetical protein
MEAFLSVSARRTFPCLFANVSDPSQDLCCETLWAQWIRACSSHSALPAKDRNIDQDTAQCRDLWLQMRNFGCGRKARE